MDYKLHSHRHALAIIKEPQFKKDWEDFCSAIDSISDDDIIKSFEEQSRKGKSISESINKLINERLVIGKKWNRQSPIFGDNRFRDKSWTLDFSKPGAILGKGGFSVEVAFNHGEATAWNLIKPVLASELNHVAKAIQTEIGIVVMATEGLKLAGGFDSAVGTYEKTLGYLEAMRNVLSIPIVVVGLNAPKSFHIRHEKVGRNMVGHIVRL